jgi:hypothetical protein
MLGALAVRAARDASVELIELDSVLFDPAI